jgi:hypothetical protein
MPCACSRARAEAVCPQRVSCGDVPAACPESLGSLKSLVCLKGLGSLRAEV